MTGTRALYRSDGSHWQRGNGAPLGNSQRAMVERQRLGEFLDYALTRPLHNTNAQNDARVDRELNGLDMRARVFAEIEMQGDAKQMFTADYEPF